MSKFLTILFFLTTSLLTAQNVSIFGVIYDHEAQNQPLAFASVYLKNTSIGTTTDLDGKYNLHVKPGSYTLVVEFLGYNTAEVPLTVSEGENKKIDHTLFAQQVMLADVIIETESNKGKETAILTGQKNGIEIIQSIGSQELSRKGVGNAENAVTKITGISKQEGVKNVFVRGLGDRYNSTTLNGFPLPSEDPEYKNITLEIFSSDIIDAVDVNKVFKSNIYGDVAGANINIQSKELYSSKELHVSAGTGFNSQIPSTFIMPDGYNFLGINHNGTQTPLHYLYEYNFVNSYKPVTQNSVFNSDFSFNFGKKIPLQGSDYLNVFAVVKMAGGFNYKDGVIRSVNSTGGAGTDMTFKKYENSAQQTGMLNFKLKLKQYTKIYLQSLFIHDAQNGIGDFTGYTTKINDNDEAVNSFIRRQQFNSNILLSNQIFSDFRLTDKISGFVGGSYNRIKGSEPDRRTNSYNFDQVYNIATNTASLNNRFYSFLTENDFNSKFYLTYSPDLNNKDLWKITAGGDLRATYRNYDYTQYNFDFASHTPIDIDQPDDVFSQSYLDLGKDRGGFNIVTGRGVNYNAFDPFYYESQRFIGSGYAQMTYPFNDKLILDGGIRVENIIQKTVWDTNISSSVTNLNVKPSLISNTFILPNINLRYAIKKDHTLRLALSKTYTFPQFKETALFLYEDVDFSSFGNPYLTYATNYNADIKYDWYLSKSEIASVGVFAKKINSPINRVGINSAANELSYVNTGNAFATGVEVELRKNLLSKQSSTTDTKFSAGFNASYLYSNQELIDVPGDNLTFDATHKTDQLEGASPFLVNADLTYNYSTSKLEWNSTLLGFSFSDRIYSIGTGGNNNIMEKGIVTLDWVNKIELKKSKIGLSVKVKNILNPNYQLYKNVDASTGTEDVIIRTYKKGITGSIGISWEL